MKKIAHIINPVAVGDSSDLSIAQPVTFQTMLTAKNFAKETIDVSLYTAQFPEDRKIVPEYFSLTPDLKRSILDCSNFRKSRKLPLLKDILDNLYSAAKNCDYMVYTNVDIAVMPYFYCTIADIISSGVDAMVINRRTISDRYKKTSEIHSMCAEIGKPHPGHDCFVFKKYVYRNFILGNATIGVNWVGRILIWNLVSNSQNFREFKGKHLTFHIGNDQKWKAGEFADYVAHNKEEALKVLRRLEQQHGDLGRIEEFRPYLSGIGKCFSESRKYSKTIQSRIQKIVQIITNSIK